MSNDLHEKIGHLAHVTNRGFRGHPCFSRPAGHPALGDGALATPQKKFPTKGATTFNEFTRQGLHHHHYRIRFHRR